MKKIFSVFLSIIMSVILVVWVCFSPAAAETENLSVEDRETQRPNTSILSGCANEDGKSNINCIVNIVLDVLTWGVGIFGVLGMIIAGIQYITSEGDAAKMTKAKNRILQVVIGLLVYALMYAALKFLIPGFDPNTSV